MVEVRYLLAIWRYRNREIFLEGWDAVRLELVRVYFWFYGVLVAGFALVFYHLDHLGSIAVIFQAYWCPQILHDARHGCKNSLRTKFVVGISVTRCLAVLYLWGCPTPVFDGDVYPSLPRSPSWTVCVMAVVVQALQLAVMASQRAFGPRWFVPRICLPAAYNYHRPVDLRQADECVICMEEPKARFSSNEHGLQERRIAGGEKGG
ncbi:unnamed protein product [Prorocentrum cordatum]|uniref:RING-type E3 ubiquitin transferase n=1 Tax=Prorocentrum cordatum TaxID=2364126 RepID=A0ABN9XE09_9DINO|nr:unnamed protein product [Polarella glacialis]